MNVASINVAREAAIENSKTAYAKAMELATSQRTKDVAVQAAKYTGAAVVFGALWGLGITVAVKTINLLN